MGCYVRGDKNGMGCYVRGDKNSVGCFVRGGKSLWDVLSGVVKKWHGMFCPGMFCPAPKLYNKKKDNKHVHEQWSWNENYFNANQSNQS